MIWHLMMNILTKVSGKLLLIFLGIFTPSILLSQTGYEFWFVAPAISYEFIPPSPILLTGLNQPITLTLSAYDSATTITITEPANSAFIPIITTVPLNNNLVVDLTPYIDIIENKPANTILPYGIHITSTKPITAFYSVGGSATSYNLESFCLKGKNALGKEFIIPDRKSVV